jgi:aldose 1-epimerase
VPDRSARVLLRAGDCEVAVDPICGSRLASLSTRGLALLVDDADDTLEWGCYPMAPWAGRLRHGRFTFDGVEHRLPLTLPPHAIHGTLFEAAWTIEERTEAAATFSAALGAPWPFAGRVVHTVAVEPDAVHLRLEVHAEEPMPAACGWHPWWRRQLTRDAATVGRPLLVDLDATTMYVRDDTKAPTGERVPLPSRPAPGERPEGPWDDCVTGLRRPPVLRWDGALELTVESDADHLVVFDEPRHAVCVEPQTGPPDALNLAPRTIGPGEPLVATATFRWRHVAGRPRST